MADSKTALFSESEYREFTVRARHLEELNIEFAFEVEHLKENNTFKITVYGEHDWDKLDELTDHIAES
tara:strand:+ start:481 stop:684 length:204 start_codon:yes stop_codon:yes gene_type:complete